MEPYPPEIEESMRCFYNTLNEKERRLYAGIEALKLGHGGLNYIAKVLGCSRNTVRKGACEVSGLSKRIVTEKIHDEKRQVAKKIRDKKHRVRNPGGGRKRYQVKWGSQLDEKFLEVLRQHTAGDLQDGTVLWTNLTVTQIVKALWEKYSISISKSVVRK